MNRESGELLPPVEPHLGLFNELTARAAAAKHDLLLRFVTQADIDAAKEQDEMDDAATRALGPLSEDEFDDYFREPILSPTIELASERVDRIREAIHGMTSAIVGDIHGFMLHTVEPYAAIFRKRTTYKGSEFLHIYMLKPQGSELQASTLTLCVSEQAPKDRPATIELNLDTALEHIRRYAGSLEAAEQMSDNELRYVLGFEDTGA